MSGEKFNSEMDALITKVPFEEALNKAGFGMYSYLLTALTGLSIISFACIAYSSNIIVPSSACELGTTSAQQGLLVAAPLIGTITGAIIWGYLADTRGRKSMLLASFFCGALINTLSSISVNWIMLMVFQFTAAFLASGQFSLPMTILSESVPMARRNHVVLVVASIFLLAQGIMALLAIPIIPLSYSIYLPALDIYWNSWRTLLLFYCLPSIIAFIWLCFMQESPKFANAKGNEEEALRILRVIHKMNNRKSKEELQVRGLLPETPVSEEKASKGLIIQLFKMPLLKFTIIMSVLSIFRQVGSFMVWLPTIANQFVEVLNTGEGTDYTLCDIVAASQDAEQDPDATPCALNVTALLIVFGVGAVQSLVNILISLFINRAGRRNVLIVLTFTCGVSGVVLNWVPNAIGSAVLFVVFLVGMVGIGLNTAISVTLFPTNLRASAMSLTMSGGRLTTFGVVQVLNHLFLNNCELGFYIFASLFASSALAAVFLPDDRFLKPQTQQEETKQVQDTYQDVTAL